jgi:hypothetical protein
LNWFTFIFLLAFSLPAYFRYDGCRACSLTQCFAQQHECGDERPDRHHGIKDRTEFFAPQQRHQAQADLKSAQQRAGP